MLTVQESQLVTDEPQGNVEHWAELQELGKDRAREGHTALLGSAQAFPGHGSTGHSEMERPRSPWGMARKILGLSGGGETP